MTVALQPQPTTIRERVVALLEELGPEARTDAIVPRLEAELTSAELRAVVAELLPPYVRSVVKSEKSRQRVDGPPTTSDTHTRLASGSPRWRTISATVRDLFEQHVELDGAIRRLGDLEPRDCLRLANDAQRIVTAARLAAIQWTRLHDLMAKRKAQHVRDLPESEVREVLAP
jgi:hypothetical protein